MLKVGSYKNKLKTKKGNRKVLNHKLKTLQNKEI